MCDKLAIIVDIDGVILDSYQVLKNMLNNQLTGDDKWDYFHENCNDRFQVPLLSNILPFLDAISLDVEIILSTSRNEKCREKTEERLKQEGIEYSRLYMRSIEDFRPSAEVKKEHIEDILKEYYVLAFIDDDLGNCEMAKSFGILALRRI